VNELDGVKVSRNADRDAADRLASEWVERIRSPLEHKFKIDKAVIDATAEYFKKLHVLSRPNNQKSSYLKCIDAILKGFDNKFVLPIKQTASEPETLLDLQTLIPGLTDADESSYLKEAIACAQAGHSRAAIVMGWCAAIDRIQRKILLIGLQKFNATSVAVKGQTSGKFKRWNKEFNVTTQGELQEIFDTDLIVIVENMGLIDGNESERLETCFQYRNHSAHPGQAPIEHAHVVSFFTDVTKIVLTNSKFAL
jgi:hypothetical protein